jgi:uncharacterized protein YegP (UPF0339 family)
VWDTAVGCHNEGRRAGKFELSRDSAGKFHFRLKARNREIIASSETEDTKASAKNGIMSVQQRTRGDDRRPDLIALTL